MINEYYLSELPAATSAPSGDQAQWTRFFSKLCECPVKTLTHLSPVQKGLTS